MLDIVGGHRGAFVRHRIDAVRTETTALREAIEGMIAEDFSGRIFSFDLDSARRYGQILAARQRIGRPISQLDAQIAAIAQAHNATLATRNTRDFEHCGIELADPWRAG